MNPHDVAPVLVTAIMFMIPIVAILTRHQQKMAIIMRTNPQAGTAQESESLRRELAELKLLMHQQTIAIDNIARKVDASAELSARLENAPR